MFGVILSQILGLSRMVFAMARRGDLPAFLAHVHPEYRVPSAAVLVVGLASAVVAWTGALGFVASAAAFTILVYYGITNLAALRLAPGDRRYNPAVAVFGLVGCGVLALSLPPRVMAIGVGLLVVGVVWKKIKN